MQLALSSLVRGQYLRFSSQGLGTVLLASLPLLAQASWPVAISDKMSAHPKQFFSTMDVLANDIGQSLEIIAVNAWSENGAQVSIFNSIGINYKAPVGFEGEDGFWYVIRDSEGRTNAARVSVNVLPASSSLPAPMDDLFQTPKDMPIRIHPLKNDLFSYPIISGRPHVTQFDERSKQGGTIKKISVYPGAELEERFIYTPSSGFVGTDSFEYTVKDGVGLSGEVNPEQTAKVTIEVLKSSEITAPAPIGNLDTIDLTCNASTILCIASPVNILKNDEGSNLIVKLDSTWSLNAGKVGLLQHRHFPPHLSYTPADGFTGEDKVWYVIEDEYGRRNWSVLTINVKNNLE